MNRREFLRAGGLGAAALAGWPGSLSGQEAGARPPGQRVAEVLNPLGRVPVGLIIDDSTCLVNLNRFAMPQFDEAFGGENPSYRRHWRDWPAEIPDAFVRKFGEWSAAQGVKGKYSIVPYPACVGRVDRLLPGWTRRELDESLELVRGLMTPNWDIHPEMVTHTRVIDTRTGQPHPEATTRFMENWDWTTGRSVDELADYLGYALRILKNVGLPCEGITTPGGFGNRARPQLAQATLESVRDVFGAPVPHYFRDLYDRGSESVAPRVEYAADLDSDDPRCVVSIVGCTGDWTGGWDCVEPEGVDRFITSDLGSGRMVDVITRGEPALMVCHWTGIYWNGEERGFRVFQEVVRRLHARFDHLLWMKLGEVARYWAARELTAISPDPTGLRFHAPFGCPRFTVRLPMPAGRGLRLRTAEAVQAFVETGRLLSLRSGAWHRDGDTVTASFDLPRGESRLEFVG
ncbi:MAG: hypothetical protein H7A45_19650 [Verrucomicrobiales bacterium]|nr:hypothetical protein [Verrucomicrobiales bacterium]MCP5525724.1 hypothetical protein [Verrucomicrobiales bacterium]